MADIQFEEDASLAPRVAPVQSGPRGMTAWMIRNKFAKDEQGAQRLLLGIALVAFVAMLFVIFTTLVPHTTPPPPPL